MTYFLYGVYAMFFALVFMKSFSRIKASFSTPNPMTDWAIGGVTYAGYNAVSAVVILPVLRHLTSIMLTRLNAPVFHFVFQLMILAALLESGAGAVHAINERVAGVLRARGRALSTAARLGISGGVLVVSIFVTTQFGLVTLISNPITRDRQCDPARAASVDVTWA